MTDELHEMLLQGGVDVSLINDSNRILEKIGVPARKLDGDISWVYDIYGKNVDYIFYLTHSSGRGGSASYIRYVVAGGHPAAHDAVVEAIPEANTGLWGKVLKTFKGIISEYYMKITVTKVNGSITDIQWVGKHSISESLNSDNVLKQKIIERCKFNKKIVKIALGYDKKYYLGEIWDTHVKQPELEDFEIFDMIAGHIKSAWFGK